MLAACGGKSKGDSTGDDGSPVTNTSLSMYFPPKAGDAWETLDPASLGWSSAGLDEVLRYAGERNSRGLVVLYRGRIIVERYWKGADLHSTGDIASAQKSVTSMLVGIAQAEGLLKTGDAVSKHLGEGWSKAPAPAESKITVWHLLTMTSGLGNTLEYEADAGSVWYYNTPAYHLLKAVIEKAGGQSIEAYSRARLFDGIGIQDSSWQPRPFMLAPLGARDAAAGVQPRPLAGLDASTRDMARFGLLALNGGVWAGEDVLRDRAYFADSIGTSQSLNPAYGYLWWLNGKEAYVLPGRGRASNGALVPSAPADLFLALGAGDKKIYVVKSMDLVVARHGVAAGVSREEALSSFDGELWQRIVAAASK